MKKIKFSCLIGLALLFAFIANANAADRVIAVSNTSVTVAASATMYSQVIDLSGKLGFFSTQIVITGSGTLTIGYQLSNSENAPYTWSLPDGGSTIATGLTAGTYMYKFEPETIGKYLRLSFIETGTSNSATLVNNLVSQ